MKARKSGVQLNIYVQPGAKKTEIAGVHGEDLKVRIQAPPVDGQANEELISFIAELFKVPKSQVSLIGGEKSRNKTLFVDNFAMNEAKKVLS